MEMATNVRDFLVGMEATVEPDVEALLDRLQALHEQYLALVTDFSAQVSDLALSLSPEARVVAHQLRLRLYQDWRARLMERLFAPSDSDVDLKHTCNNDADVCVCTLDERLAKYKDVLDEFVAVSPTIKSNPAGDDDAGGNNPRAFGSSDSNEFSDDGGLADQCFVFPEFLRIQSFA